MVCCVAALVVLSALTRVLAPALAWVRGGTAAPATPAMPPPARYDPRPAPRADAAVAP